MPKLMNQTVDLPLDTDATVEVLNRILHFELSGVMQHFHHRWMSRWLGTSRPRAIAIGQHIASLTGAPAVGVDELLDDALSSANGLLDAARMYDQRRVEEYRRPRSVRPRAAGRRGTPGCRGTAGLQAEARRPVLALGMRPARATKPPARTTCTPWRLAPGRPGDQVLL